MPPVRPRRRPIAEPRIELIPLLDVLFFLLTFFIFALAVAAKLRVTGIQLPGIAEGGSSGRGESAVVALKDSGEILLDDRPVTLDALGGALDRLRAERPGVTIYIATDERAPTGDLFRLVDALQAAKVGELRFIRRARETAK